MNMAEISLVARHNHSGFVRSTAYCMARVRSVATSQQAERARNISDDPELLQRSSGPTPGNETAPPEGISIFRPQIFACTVRVIRHSTSFQASSQDSPTVKRG